MSHEQFRPDFSDVPPDEALPEEGSEMPSLLVRAGGDETHLALLVAQRKAQKAFEDSTPDDREALREAHTAATNALVDYEYAKNPPPSSS